MKLDSLSPLKGSISKKKRKGIHSKNRNTNQKGGKYYKGSKYRGQGR